MPIYEYICHECGTRCEMYRPMREFNAPAECGLGHSMERVHSVPALAIWDASRPFLNAVNFGPGTFSSKKAYEAHLVEKGMGETKTDGKNRSKVPRSMRA